jgi:hypothetical protein
VPTGLRAHPPPGPPPLRHRRAPAYGIGTPKQKIKFFGGWARKSDVVLDFIDPIVVLPSPGAWQLFGWMTPGGAPPINTRQSVTSDIPEPQHNLNGHIGNIAV